MKTNKKVLENQFDEALREVLQTVREFPWEDPACYAAWLAQTYYFVRHSTHLLALKAAKYTPAQEERHRAALVHLREETGHDVMALRDLKTLGHDIQDIPELIEISLFYQSQYYFLDQHGALALTGYTLMLEELACREGASVAKRIVEAHGKQAASFLLLHSKADIEHTELQQKEFEGAAPEQVEAAMQNLRQCAYLYDQMLRKIKEGARSKLKSRPKLKIVA